MKASNENTPDKFSDDVDPPMSPLSPLGREVFDMMNNMNRAFEREFKRNNGDKTDVR